MGAMPKHTSFGGFTSLPGKGRGVRESKRSLHESWAMLFLLSSLEFTWALFRGIVLAYLVWTSITV